MKRSRSIRLVLVGSLSAGLTSCAPNGDDGSNPIRPDAVYGNNHYVPGVGYYHAPYRAWYPLPYNHYDPRLRSYFYGGQWSTLPDASITNLSSPTPAMAQTAQAQRTDVARSGFGSTSRRHSTWS